MQLVDPIALAKVDLFDFLDERAVHLGEYLYLLLHGLESDHFALFWSRRVQNQAEFGAAQALVEEELTLSRLEEPLYIVVLFNPIDFTRRNVNIVHLLVQALVFRH